MEFAEATEMMTPKGNPVTVAEMEANVVQAHAGNTQREAYARMALAKIREGIAELAALGHQFMLVEGENTSALQFPQMIYRMESGTVRERTIQNGDELGDALANGWTKDPKGQAAARTPAAPPMTISPE